MSIDRPGPGEDEQNMKWDVSVERLAEIHKEDIRRIERLNISNDSGKAQIILVLLGEQPAVDIWLYPQDDSSETVVSILKNAGLFVEADQITKPMGWKINRLYIARTAETAHELLLIAPLRGARIEHEKYAQLMGFPQTAIDAFVGRSPLLSEEKDTKIFHDTSILFGIKFSKSNWAEELQFLRKRSLLIKKYAPDLYEQMVKTPEEFAEDDT